MLRDSGACWTLRYDALVADVDASISSLESTKSDLEGTMADDESSADSDSNFAVFAESVTLHVASCTLVVSAARQGGSGTPSPLPWELSMKSKEKKVNAAPGHCYWRSFCSERPVPPFRSMTTEKGERTTNQEDLDSTLAFLKEIAPGCDFIAVNFNTRLKNRQAEVAPHAFVRCQQRKRLGRTWGKTAGYPRPGSTVQHSLRESSTQETNQY